MLVANIGSPGPGIVYKGNGQWVIGPSLQYNAKLSASYGPGQPGVPQMARQVGDMGDISGEAPITFNAPTKEEHTQLRAEVDRLTQIVKNQNDDIIQLFSEVQKLQRILHAAQARQSAARGLPGYWEET